MDTCQVNLTNQRMRVVWDDKNCRLAKFWQMCKPLGMMPNPIGQDTHEAMLKRDNRHYVVSIRHCGIGCYASDDVHNGAIFWEYSGIGVNDRQFYAGYRCLLVFLCFDCRVAIFSIGVVSHQSPPSQYGCAD